MANVSKERVQVKLHNNKTQRYSHGSSSKWDPWIRVLPTEFDTPLMLERKILYCHTVPLISIIAMDLELLQGSTLLELSQILRYGYILLVAIVY